MSTDEKRPITFDMHPDNLTAMAKLAGDRQIRLSGQIKDGKLVIDTVGFANSEFNRAVFVPVNAPFKTALAAAASA